MDEELIEDERTEATDVVSYERDGKGGEIRNKRQKGLSPTQHSFQRYTF